jgi:hypothetical protein
MLTVLSLLAKKLISLDPLNFQAAFIRIEGTLRSVSPLQSSDSAVANLQTLTSTESALTNTAELTCAESALAENKNLKLSGINTCKKIVSGPSHFRAVVLAFRVTRRVRYSSAASLEKSAIRSGSPSRATNGSEASLRTCRSSTRGQFSRGRVRPKYRLKKGN